MNKKEFLREYSAALKRGTASVFLGAGVSMDAGYPSWKGLLAGIAKELDIDLDVEYDLAGVAQWYINHNKKTRTKIAKVIKEAFPEKADVPESLKVLARLPLKHVWTTNYDRLIETAWDQAGKKIDVKTRIDDLTIPDPTASATLYKMHGSVDSPADVVISKEDYELYRREKGAFFHLLTGHSLGMSLLFIGFSFTDANVAHLFGLLREIVRETPPQHYAIVRRPPPPDSAKSAAAKEKARRELSRHQHWVADLERYGLNCVEVDNFSEIPLLLKEVEAAVANASVFVSGSYPVQARDSGEGTRVRDVAQGVGRIIAQQGARLVSGFGLEVGSAVIAGVMGEAHKAKYVNLDSILLLRPFPQTLPKGLDQEAFKKQYREDMVAQSGVCIVIGGMVKKGKDYEVAPGVLAEVALARAAGRPVLPLGITGGAACQVWEEMLSLSPKERHGITKRDFVALGEAPVSVPEYLEHVEKLLKRLRGV
ncbi:SIR2-like protein [Paraburkholderia sp. BL6669N2]|uniref:SIR2 family protein n=1 Tax=Paraburkholderia sp. BL6669N2 TaxID=1938807 RepID=UPI000E223FA4|nr:SIR2 family protein [Paraburkholderia sp. BL6669N2]REG60857.1 SIR2-like protein [Paraburkholderia sp. BL6669N2]